MGFAVLDTWLPFLRDTSNVFDLAEGLTKLSHKHSLMAMFSSLVEQCQPALFVSRLTGCFNCMKLARGSSVQGVLLVRPFGLWVVTCTIMSLLYMLMMMMRMSEHLLMCLLNLTSTFVPVFVETSTNFESCALQPMMKYQRVPGTFSICLCKNYTQ